MITKEDLERLEEEAIRMNGYAGVKTILCPHCGKLVMSNHVGLRKAWIEYEEQQKNSLQR
jgi:hypothetical protein